MNHITIIGYGKLGSHLYRALKESAKFRLDKLTIKTSPEVTDNIIEKTDIIFICTPDKQINNTVLDLENLNLNFKNKVVFHTSGALNSDILLPLKKKGAWIASFHPIQSFSRVTNSYTDKFMNIYLAIEGDKTAINKAKEVAEILGSKTIKLNKKEKIIHHIFCVIISNYLVTLLSQIEIILKKPSFKKTKKKILFNVFKNENIFSIYKPLLMSTLSNCETHGYVNSLTGPIERNDIETIKIHLKELNKRFPELLNFYILMGEETIKVALYKKSIKNHEAKKLHQLFKKYSKILKPVE